MHIDPVPGRQCAYQHRVVEIDGPCSSSKVSVRDVATGEMLEIPVGDLLPIRKRAEETKSDPRFVSRAAWEKALSLASCLAPLAAEGGPLCSDEAERVAKKLSVSERTVRRGFLRFKSNHRTSDLVPRHGGRPAGLRLCSPQIEAIISACIQKHYLTREAPTTSYLMDQIRAACLEKRLKPPARSTVTRRIDSIAAYERARRRQGRRAAKQKYEPRTGSLRAQRPLQIVQMTTRAAITCCLPTTQSVFRSDGPG